MARLACPLGAMRCLQHKGSHGATLRRAASSGHRPPQQHTSRLPLRTGLQPAHDRSRCIATFQRLVSSHASGRKMVTLERAVGSNLGADDALWRTGAFAASVYPDLPAAMTLTDWARHRVQAVFGAHDREDGGADGEQWHAHWGARQLIEPGSGTLVRTVACQSRTRDELRSCLLQAAGAAEAGTQAAGALLILSGSDPGRLLPSFLVQKTSSPQLLAMAAEMRTRGELPATLQLWAVANPMRDDPKSLLPKLDAGAEVILTQPALDRDRFARWLSGARDLGATERARVLAGVPVVSSTANMRFWGFLCGAQSLPGYARNVEAFADAAGEGPAAVKALRERWAGDLARDMLRQDGVAGIHVMATTQAAKETAKRLAESGAFATDS
ncbi:unnamed protein product [Pedinophyceae sp. YPF-701]|nr:unnamed protein product [Pedinophyceae sp. YPF-701]